MLGLGAGVCGRIVDGEARGCRCEVWVGVRLWSVGVGVGPLHATPYLASHAASNSITLLAFTSEILI